MWKFHDISSSDKKETSVALATMTPCKQVVLGDQWVVNYYLPEPDPKGAGWIVEIQGPARLQVDLKDFGRDIDEHGGPILAWLLAKLWFPVMEAYLKEIREGFVESKRLFNSLLAL